MNKLGHFISDIMDYFWLAKTSNKPISLTTWLAVNPHLKLTFTAETLHALVYLTTSTRMDNLTTAGLGNSESHYNFDNMISKETHSICVPGLHIQVTFDRYKSYFV